VGRFYAAEKKAPSTDAIKETLALLCARAQFEGRQRDVGVRVLRSGENIYIFLADEQWRAIEIQKSRWRIAADASALFIKTRGMCALPVPTAGGDLRTLKNLLHINTDQWILVVAWLVAALNPDGPYPVLVLHGEQGSAKSTLTRLLRRLIDHSIPLLRSAPRDERDLIVMARSCWVITIDNLSGAQQWFSDALCRLSTGGGFGTRQLYTDEEEILFDGKRPIILNGIEDIARSPDLADRAITLTLPAISEEKRLTEKEYWQRFDEVQSGILGALLNAVAAANANLEHTTISKPPRMADFATWVCAAAPALPFTAEEFLRSYRENRSESTLMALESSAVASAILRLINENEWKGTYTGLLDKLNQTATEATRNSKVWPKNARALSGALRRFAPALRAAGCFIEELARDHETKAKRISIQKGAADSAKKTKPDPTEGSHSEPLVEEVI
jgi:hypothetical protein